MSEGCPILTTCSSRESGDLSDATGTSPTSREVVNVRRFSEITRSIYWRLCISL